MKKLYILFAVAALAAVSCAKEGPQVDPENNNPDKGLVTYTLTGRIMEMKAYADEADAGALKWESGDKIAVYNSTTDEYVIFSTTGSGASTDFTATAPAGAVFTKAYYPSDYRGGDVASYYASKYAGISVTDSKKAFAMEVASIEAGATDIAFVQKGALVKFSVSNLPEFAATAKLVAGTLIETVAISATEAATGSVDVYFAIPAGASTLAFSVLDNAATPNSFYSKERASAAYNLASLYRYNVAIGNAIRFTDAKDWSTKMLHVWNADDGSFNIDFKTDAAYPYTFHTITANDHYIIAPAELDWMADGAPLGIAFYNGSWETGNATQTDRFYCRNAVFNVPLELGMKTDYRIYPYSDDKTNINIFITKPLQLHTSGDWGNFQIYWWSNKTGDKVEPWGDWDTRKDGNWTAVGSTLDIPAQLVGQATDSGVIVGDLGGTHSQYNTYFCGDISVDIRGSGPFTFDEDTDSKRVSSVWPGDAKTISTTVNTNVFFNLPVEHYGQELWIVFSENGSSVSSTIVETINRDLNLEY